MPRSGGWSQPLVRVRGGPVSAQDSSLLGACRLEKPAPDRAAWLEWRRAGIGASDAAAVVGLSRWGSAYSVWLDKTGRTPLDRPATAAMRWGLLLEDAVCKAFEEEHDTDVIWRGAWAQNVATSWLRATLDGICVLDGEVCVVELKTSNGRDGAWDQGVPDYYQVQVQHQMAVTGAQRAFVAVLLGGSEYASYEIERDEEALAVLLPALEAFWRDHVAADRPPDVDGAIATGVALRQAFAKSEPKAVELPDQAEGLLRELASAKAAVKEAEARETAAQNRVMALLGDAELGTLGGYVVVTWKSQVSRRIDVARLRTELPEVADQYTQESRSRALRIVRRESGD